MFRWKDSVKDYKSVTKKYNIYKNRAIKKGIEFSLSEYKFYKLISSECYCCGVFENTYIGVDRLNNNDGYNDVNTRGCCWDCNRAKSDMSLDQFAEWISKFNLKKRDEIYKLKRSTDLCKKLNLKSEKEAFNEQLNNSLFEHSEVFYPKILNVIKVTTRKPAYYVKSFRLLGRLFTFHDEYRESDCLPPHLIREIVLHSKIPTKVVAILK